MNAFFYLFPKQWISIARVKTREWCPGKHNRNDIDVYTLRMVLSERFQRVELSKGEKR